MTRHPRLLILAFVVPGCGAPAATQPDAPGAGADAAEVDATDHKTCGGEIVDVMDPATGCAEISSCTACPIPAGASAAICTAGACDFTCPAGTTKTADGCAPPVAADATRIAAGDSHTCAVTSTGGAKCWGYNGHGRLGNNSAIDARVPVDVVGLTSGVASIAAGGGHTCVVTTAGGAKCWGLNNLGQLGINSGVNSPVALDVLGLTSGVVAIAAGNVHTCALTSAGSVKCWGHNGKGQLGINSNDPYALIPVAVSGLASGAIAIAAGDVHTCAVMASGTVKCWGDNVHGQLGNNTTVASKVPVTVSGLLDAADVFAGGEGFFGRSHSCALTAAGGVRCWGNHGFGQLGTGGFESGSLVPVTAMGLASGIIALGAGDLHVCAVTAAGAVKGWGDGSSGQLGSVTTTEALGPRDIPGLASGVTAIAAGGRHTCVMTAGGGIKCVGTNANGQLGNNSTTKSVTPVDVVGF